VSTSFTHRLRNRLWVAGIRLGSWRERWLRNFNPARMRHFHYSWPLRPEDCPCDLDFAELLVARGIRRKSIFHFGSGGHHWIGRCNHEAELGNEVLALTLSPREHASYVRSIVRDPSLGRHYKVLFADLYALNTAALPTFDIVTLFHLCEFSPPAGDPQRLDDEQLLRLFCSRLSRDGLMIFYSGSFAFAKQAPIIEQAVARGLLSFVEEFKSLRIYRAGEVAR
jgi:hypothetical protein